MNFFIDFDHTLYDTDNLSKDMLDALAKYICEKTSKNYEEILEKLKGKFKRGKGNFFDIYDLIEHFSLPEQYNYNKEEATEKVNEIISNGKKYVFEDSIPFLQYLKSKEHKTYILSYNENKVYFQTVKIAGSGLLNYVDGLIPTTVIKGEMPFDFSQSIFIDDKPKDLISIYNKNPFGVFRVKRENEKYSHLETGLPIQEFKNLTELKEKLEKERI